MIYLSTKDLVSFHSFRRPSRFNTTHLHTSIRKLGNYGKIFEKKNIFHLTNQFKMEVILNFCIAIEIIFFFNFLKNIYIQTLRFTSFTFSFLEKIIKLK
jgi:hypothetical protein